MAILLPVPRQVQGLRHGPPHPAWLSCLPSPSCSPPPSWNPKALRPQALPSPKGEDPLVLLRAGAALTHVSHPKAGRHPAPGREPCGPVARNGASLRSRARRESAPAAPPAHTLPRRPDAPIRAFFRPVSSFRLPGGVASTGVGAGPRLRCRKPS